MVGETKQTKTNKKLKYLVEKEATLATTMVDQYLFIHLNQTDRTNKIV